MTVLEEIETADEAFLSASAPKELNGTALEPFSLMRQTIAMEIVNSIPNPSVFLDGVVRVWVCTLKEREALLAWKDKDKATLDAFEWASKSGFSLENPRGLLDLYKRINAEIAPALHVETKDGKPLPNESGEQPAL